MAMWGSMVRQIGCWMVAHVEGIYTRRDVLCIKKNKIAAARWYENARQIPPRVRDDWLMKLVGGVPRGI